MIGKRRRERRRQARAAIERYEYNAANDAGRVEAAEQRAEQAEARNDELRRLCQGMEKRLDDANRELARWGLEPVTRDLPESDEHPQRYRRHSDWRTTRSGAELAELLERHAECAPAGVDVSVAWHDDPTQFLRACGEDAVTHAYEPPPFVQLQCEDGCRLGPQHLGPCLVDAESPDVCITIEDGSGRTATVTQEVADRLYAEATGMHRPDDLPAPERPERPPLPPVLEQIKRDLVEGIAEALKVPREQRATERVVHLRAALGEAHGALRERKRQVSGQARRITRLVAELDDVRGEYAGYRMGAMQAEADYERRLSVLGELAKVPSLTKGDRVQVGVGSHVHIGVVADVTHLDDGTTEIRFE